MDRSVVQFLPNKSGHSCGYCKSSDGSISDGLWAYTMTVQDYQDLVDRGWRRSGMYCYKPIMNITCCPAYTIKCDALNVKLSKSQKKIIKRMRKFLIDGKKSGLDEKDSLPDDDDICDERVKLDNFSGKIADIDMKEVDTSITDSCSDVKQNQMDEIDNTVVSDSVSNLGSLVPPEISDKERDQKSPPSKTSLRKNTHAGRDLSKPLMKKAKLIRLERKKSKQLGKSNSQENNQEVNDKSKNDESKAKTLEDFLFELLPENSKHNLEIKLVNLNGSSPDVQELFNEELKLYQKYQVVIHNDSIKKCTSEQFNRFLVQSPLKLENQECGPTSGYGSFHQQYWLDGKLIAVGVIDILPYCVSSVYFFYDPDYSFLSLGTYSSLREVSYTRWLNQTAPSLNNYYMGFYIHSCPKMRYKGKISPSYLLCPEVYSWHNIESCVAKLDKCKYSRLNDDINAIPKDSNVDINKVLILWKNVSVDFGRYKRLSKKGVKTDEINYFAKLVGKNCCQRMLLYQ